MIRFTGGNLLDAQAEALVNTVNTVGVMGKGIALMFREAFPENFRIYEAACKREEVTVGKMLVTENHALAGPRYIINFPTKKHWIHPSRMEWIHAGLQDLVRVIREKNIRSIALPPLGCGNGGLPWPSVRNEIERALSALPEVDIVVFEPTDTYQNKPKKGGVEELTPARAMLVELVRRYLILGFECSNLEVHKLAYFLQRFILAYNLPNPLKLNFKANKYGPYADNLRQLLNALDGSYLHSAKRLADAGPLEPISLDHGRLPEVKEYIATEKVRRFRIAIEATEWLIDGFETPYLMELLSTVDWLQAERGGSLDDEGLLRGIANGPGGKQSAERKARLFNRDAVTLANERLHEYRQLLYRS
jgi:O-acetyl-ADP-ribose deacetylase (regulator of RNase III)